MELKELKNVLNSDYGITLVLSHKEDAETWSDDYMEFSDIEEERLTREVKCIEMWDNPRHNNDKMYLITIE